MKKIITKDMLEAIQVKKRHTHLVELFYSLHYAKQTFTSIMSNLKRLGPVEINEHTPEYLEYYSGGGLYVNKEGQLQTPVNFYVLPVALIQEGKYVTVKEFNFLDSILDSLVPGDDYDIFRILAYSESEDELLTKFEPYFFNFYESTTLMIERILSEFDTFIQIHNTLSYLAKGFDPDCHYDTGWRVLEDDSLPF